ncbi:EF-hand [Apiospora arundinis]
MEKCWFVLRQTQYPPPAYHINGKGQTEQTGALCLGDLIPTLKKLDFRINETGPPTLPVSIPVHTTSSENFRWEMTKENEWSLSASLGVPIAALFGLTVGAELSPEFKKALSRHTESEGLEAKIIQPTPSYIESALSTPEVAHWIEQKKLRVRELFMITGIMVLKGKKSREITQTQGNRVSGGPNVELPTIATAELEAACSTSSTLSHSVDGASDFIWAIRLAKISRGILDSTWTPRTLSKGATFGMKEHRVQIQTILAEEGLEATEIVQTSDGGLVFQGAE